MKKNSCNLVEAVTSIIHHDDLRAFLTEFQSCFIEEPALWYKASQFAAFKDSLQLPRVLAKNPKKLTWMFNHEQTSLLLPRLHTDLLLLNILKMPQVDVHCLTQLLYMLASLFKFQTYKEYYELHGFSKPLTFEYMRPVQPPVICTIHNLASLNVAGHSAAIRKILQCLENPYELLQALIEFHFDSYDIESLPLPMVFLIKKALNHCKMNPRSDWPESAYLLIDREDLAIQFYHPNDVIQKKEKIEASDMNALYLKDKETASKNSKVAIDPLNSNLINSRFPHDLRIREVHALTQSDVPAKLKLPPAVEGADDQSEQQIHLIALASRTLALPVGRGMLCLGLGNPLLESNYSIRPMQVGAQFLPFKTVVNLQTSTLVPDFSKWGEFNNGVAAALEIPKGSPIVDHSWIISHRPAELNAEHAGFLFGLGLQGNLEALNNIEVYQYMSANHEFTSLALLLGLTFSKMNTMDSKLTKICSIHVPSLLPNTSEEPPLPNLCSTAAMVGIGFLYLRTCHRRMVEVMLHELTRQDLHGQLLIPCLNNEIITDHYRGYSEWYALSSAISLGLILLGQGSSSLGLRDLMIEEKLRKCIFGGKIGKETGHQKFSTRQKSNNFNSAMPMQSSNRLNTTAGNSVSTNATSQNRCQTYNKIHTDVTAPAAIVALSLIYLQTNELSVAQIVQIPQTLYSMLQQRPDILMLNAISYNLIMWDKIESSLKWITSMIPSPLKARTSSEFASLFVNRTQSELQCLYSIVTGLVLSIGLKYAGTLDKVAHQTVVSYLALLTDKLNFVAVGYSQRVTKSLIKNCYCISLLSAAMIVAGTGDIDLTRMIRKMHGKSQQLNYGQQMMVHMALGFLYLSGGTRSLNNTTLENVATLYLSVYPALPVHPFENQYHLQLLRHFYVYSVEDRCFVTRNESHEIVSVPVDVKLKHEDSTMTLYSPCLLPPLRNIEVLQISCKDYFPVEWRHEGSVQLPLTFFLKARTNVHQLQLFKTVEETYCDRVVYEECFLNNETDMTDLYQEYVSTVERIIEGKGDLMDVENADALIRSHSKQLLPTLNYQVTRKVSDHFAGIVKSLKARVFDKCKGDHALYAKEIMRVLLSYEGLTQEERWAFIYYQLPLATDRQYLIQAISKFYNGNLRLDQLAYAVYFYVQHRYPFKTILTICEFLF